MHLKDATLMVLAESADHSGLAGLAQSAYDQLITHGEVDYHLLNGMIAEASSSLSLGAVVTGTDRFVWRSEGAAAARCY
jgi:hypothetical protein